ncbi:MAG: RNA polymerase sigma factor, partial [Candidatus Kapaibacterium sp.]
MDNEEQQRYFLSLFEPIRERLWRYVRAMSRADNDTVHDIMGETILNVYGKTSSLRSPEYFSAYCFTTARRVYLRDRR